MTSLQSARAKLMDAQDEYLADRIEVHGDNAATRKEAFLRIHQLWGACQSVVKACRDNDADPSDDRAAVMVGLMMDDTPDEKYMIGWMCEVAAMEGE